MDSSLGQMVVRDQCLIENQNKNLVDFQELDKINPSEMGIYGKANKPRTEEPTMFKILEWNNPEPQSSDLLKTTKERSIKDRINKTQSRWTSETMDNFRKFEFNPENQRYYFNYLDPRQGVSQNTRAEIREEVLKEVEEDKERIVRQMVNQRLYHSIYQRDYSPDHYDPLFRQRHRIQMEKEEIERHRMEREEATQKMVEEERKRIRREKRLASKGKKGRKGAQARQRPQTAKTKFNTQAAQQAKGKTQEKTPNKMDSKKEPMKGTQGKEAKPQITQKQKKNMPVEMKNYSIESFPVVKSPEKPLGKH